MNYLFLEQVCLNIYCVVGYGQHTLATHISIVKKSDIDDILSGNAGHLRGNAVSTASDSASATPRWFTFVSVSRGQMRWDWIGFK